MKFECIESCKGCKYQVFVECALGVFCAKGNFPANCKDYETEVGE